MSGESKHPSFLALDQYVLGAVSDASMQQHIEECVVCQTHLEAAQVVDGVPRWVRQMSEPRRARKPWLWLMFAGTVVAAAAIVLMLWTPPQDQHSVTGVKGEPSIMVHIKRDARVMLWDGQTAIRPYDRIQLEIAADGFEQVSVYSASTTAGRTSYTLLYKGRLAPGLPGLLPKAWQVDAEPGPEVLVVVLGDGEFFGRSRWIKSLRLKKE